ALRPFPTRRSSDLTHDDALAGLDLPLLAFRTLGDLALEVAQLDAADDAADPVDLGEDLLGLTLEAVGERLHIVRAGQGVDRVRHPRLVGQDLLGAQGDPD